LKAILQLRKVLDEGDVQKARSALSKHLGRLVLTPTLKNGKKIFRVTGAVNLQPGNGVMQLVARDGIEPPTPAFFRAVRSTTYKLCFYENTRLTR
jgi:hypothetical protein